MSLPTHISHVLGHGEWDLPGRVDKVCEGAVYHSPRPLFTETTPLVPEDWLDPIPATVPTAWLCGTCRDNLRILLQMLYATDGGLEWPIRREFGNAIRALATRGWAYFTEHRPAPAPTDPA